MGCKYNQSYSLIIVFWSGFWSATKQSILLLYSKRIACIFVTSQTGMRRTENIFEMHSVRTVPSDTIFELYNVLVALKTSVKVTSTKQNSNYGRKVVQLCNQGVESAETSVWADLTDVHELAGCCVTSGRAKRQHVERQHGNTDNTMRMVGCMKCIWCEYAGVCCRYAVGMWCEWAQWRY